MGRIVTFGEIMLRLSPPLNKRIGRDEVFEKYAGGAELNVASGISLLGLRTAVISKLPNNQIGTFVKNRIRFNTVSDDFLLWDDSANARLGIYYYENGAYPRKPSVVYDRKGSSFNSISLSEIPDSVYSSARMFYTSGITLALSENTRNVAVEMIKRFKAGGALIAFDVNYRANLWKGRTDAIDLMKSLFPLADTVKVSDEELALLLGENISAEEGGNKILDLGASLAMITLGAKGVFYAAKVPDGKRISGTIPVRKVDVVDTTGAGDSFTGGILYRLTRRENPLDFTKEELEADLKFANTVASICVTRRGAIPALPSLSEVEESLR